MKSSSPSPPPCRAEPACPFSKSSIPTRYFDVGIAEEHAALFACGLATQGLKPFLTIYSTFMQRAYDMIIHDIALQNLNVALCMDRGGLSGDDGPTHHGFSTSATCATSRTSSTCSRRTKTNSSTCSGPWRIYNSGPIAIRYPRGTGTGAQAEGTPELLEIGKAEVVNTAARWPSSAWAICSRWRRSRALLEAQGISVALINPRWIKPLDTGTIEFFARSVDVVCTIEDHVLHNGFGCAVIEHLHEPVSIRRWCGSAGPTNSSNTAPSILRQKHGLTADALVEKVLPLLRKKSSLRPSVA